MRSSEIGHALLTSKGAMNINTPIKDVTEGIIGVCCTLSGFT